jgi:hypothetical protein
MDAPVGVNHDMSDEQAMTIGVRISPALHPGYRPRLDKAE